MVPLEFEGQPFLAGSAPIPNAAFIWNAPGLECSEERQQFSLNTCNGCHAGETSTPFFHVAPRSSGTESALSQFLTGRSLTRDRSCPDDVEPVEREFADLERRACDLAKLLSAATIDDVFDKNRRKFVH